MEWIKIPGHPNHSASSEGEIRNDIHGSILNKKNHKNEVGTSSYDLVFVDRKWRYVHRLVATAFIPNPENKKEINHKNGVKKDNRVDNLEWCTRGENLTHAIRTGLKAKLIMKGKDNYNSIPVVAIKDLAIIEAESVSQLAKILGRTVSTATEALREGHRCAGYRIYSMA